MNHNPDIKQSHQHNNQHEMQTYSSVIHAEHAVDSCLFPVTLYSQASLTWFIAFASELYTALIAKILAFIY